MRQETGEQKIEIHSLLRQPSINFIALYFSALCFMKHTASAAAQHHRQKKSKRRAQNSSAAPMALIIFHSSLRDNHLAHEDTALFPRTLRL
jgi:hypothetical protein